MRWANRRDLNHAQIVKELRDAHIWVYDTSRVGGGFPDLVVCSRNCLRLVEIKSERGKLTPAQERFMLENPQALSLIAHRAEDVIDYYNRRGL